MRSAAPQRNTHTHNVDSHYRHVAARPSNCLSPRYAPTQSKKSVGQRCSRVSVCKVACAHVCAHRHVQALLCVTDVAVDVAVVSMLKLVWMCSAVCVHLQIVFECVPSVFCGRLAGHTCPTFGIHVSVFWDTCSSVLMVIASHYRF